MLIYSLISLLRNLGWFGTSLQLDMESEDLRAEQRHLPHDVACGS
jgi:hypothetical protein